MSKLKVNYVKVYGTSGHVRRTPHWVADMEAIIARDGPNCFYCGRKRGMDQLRSDHFIPRSRGGSDGIENRRAACQACDRAKKNQMPWEFMPGVFKAPDGNVNPRDPHPPWVLRVGSDDD